MSRENVEILRALYDAWNSDERRITTKEFLADDFEWVNPDYAVEPGSTSWAGAMDSLYAAFGDFEHRPLEFIDLGNRVLCFRDLLGKDRRERYSA